jgi:hypothetical protein
MANKQQCDAMKQCRHFIRLFGRSKSVRPPHAQQSTYITIDATFVALPIVGVGPSTLPSYTLQHNKADMRQHQAPRYLCHHQRALCVDLHQKIFCLDTIWGGFAP